MRKTLLSIVATLLATSQVVIAQQKNWTDIILNYNGKDTILYKDAKIEYSIIKDGQKYKVFKGESFGQFKPEQCALPWNNAEVEKALRRKNVLLRYNTLEDAMMSISGVKEDNYRLMKENVAEYFQVASEGFPKQETQPGQKLRGDERKFYEECRTTTKQCIDKLTSQGKSTEGLDYVLRFLNEKLDASTKITDQKTGSIMLSKDADGKDIYVVIVEYPPSIYGKYADMNALPYSKTQEVLFKYAKDVLKKDVKTYKGSKLWELTTTNDGKYKVAVVYWQIGKEKEDQQVKATITERCKLIQE